MLALNCSLLLQLVTMASTNIIAQGDSCLISSVNQYITTHNKKTLRTNALGSSTSTSKSSIAHTSNLTVVFLPSYSAVLDFLIQFLTYSLGTLSYVFSVYNDTAEPLTFPIYVLLHQRAQSNIAFVVFFSA